MNQSFRLSVAELAFAMAHSGDVEAAYGYLQTMLAVEPERFNDWMTAASHALVARDLLEVTPDGGYGPLHGDLQRVAKAIVQDQGTLRCHRIRRSGESYDEQFVTVLFTDDMALAHWVEQNVVAMIESLSGSGEAYDRIAAFVGVSQSTAEAESSQEVQLLPMDELSRLREMSSKMPSARIAQELRRFLTAPWIDAMADTLADPGAWWGDVLRIDRVANEIVAEEGFLFVASSGKAWLLGTNPQNGAAMAVIPATRSAIATWCAALV